MYRLWLAFLLGVITFQDREPAKPIVLPSSVLIQKEKPWRTYAALYKEVNQPKKDVYILVTADW